MNLPPVTYVTVDSLADGVTRSQVVPYVERLARCGVAVTLHTFERGSPDVDTLVAGLAAAGVTWRPHAFGGHGATGGLARVARCAPLVAGRALVHARSDMVAAAAVLTGQRRWVWDMRGLWREQRIALGMLRPGSAQERAMRGFEASAARSSRAIVALSAAAVGVLEERYGEEVAAKATVITTCVDLDRYPCSPFPEPPVRLLLAGSLNRLYDMATMLRFVTRLQARRAAELTVITPGPTPWDDLLSGAGVAARRLGSDGMASVVGAHHAGLCVLSAANGISNRAAMPTKLGEILACGRPVVVNAGLGDMDDLLAGRDCGVIVGSTSDDDLDRAAAALDRLLDDPGTPGRCRALAQDHFDLDRGVDALVAVYRGAVG